MTRPKGGRPPGRRKRIKSSGGGSKKSGCPFLILAFIASLMPALLMAYVADVIWG